MKPKTPEQVAFEAKVRAKYPKTKECTGPCGRKRRTTMFRVLRSGYLQGMCTDCERGYERDRWHTRSGDSKQESGGSAAVRRRAAA